MISDMDYIRKVAFDEFKPYGAGSTNCRNDVFLIKTFADRDSRRVILNENKLQSIYK
jgi:hypothetical protein